MGLLLILQRTIPRKQSKNQPLALRGASVWAGTECNVNIDSADCSLPGVLCDERDLDLAEALRSSILAKELLPSVLQPAVASCLVNAPLTFDSTVQGNAVQTSVWALVATGSESRA